LNAQKLSIDNSGFFYQIAPLYDFKQSVVSLTFDDGWVTQFTVALPLLKQRNIPATFYVITNNIDSVSKGFLAENISNDYELGSHTASHQNLVKIGNEEAEKELSDSKMFLKKHFGKNSGLTMAFPWGIYNSSVKQLVKKTYLAARSTGVGYNSFYKLERYDLRMQSFDKQTSAFTANSWVDYAIKNKLWLVEMLHGINDIGFSPISSEVFSEHLDYLNTVSDKIWCSTVSNVIKYIDESGNAKVECDLCNDTIYKIRIYDFMDDSIYNQPLSIKIKVPGNWDSISISNNEKIKTEYNNNSKFILFNALPDNNQIIIRPELISDAENETGLRLVYLSANPFIDNIRLTLEALDKQDVEIVLCNISGRILIRQNEKAVKGVINLNFDTSGMSNGVYFLKVTSNIHGSCIIRKMIRI